MVIRKKKKMIKITKAVEDNLPLWSGKLSYSIDATEITEQSEWSEIAPNKFMLSEPTGEAESNILSLLDYFTSKKVLEDLPIVMMANEIIKEWPIHNITDIDFLKKILNCSVTIEKYEVGRVELPTTDNRLIFGKIIVNLTDYLLTPPIQFTSNVAWPVNDVVYEHDFDYLDTLFFLNSDKLYYSTQNNSKRDAYFLICDLTLEPLFLVDNNS